MHETPNLTLVRWSLVAQKHGLMCPGFISIWSRPTVDRASVFSATCLFSGIHFTSVIFFSFVLLLLKMFLVFLQQLQVVWENITLDHLPLAGLALTVHPSRHARNELLSPPPYYGCAVWSYAGPHGGNGDQRARGQTRDKLYRVWEEKAIEHLPWKFRCAFRAL